MKILPQDGLTKSIEGIKKKSEKKTDTTIKLLALFISINRARRATVVSLKLILEAGTAKD